MPSLGKSVLTEVTHVLDEEVLLAHKKASARQLQKLAQRNLCAKSHRELESSSSATERHASENRDVSEKPAAQGLGNLFGPTEKTPLDAQGTGKEERAKGQVHLQRCSSSNFETRVADLKEMLQKKESPSKEEIRERMQSMIRQRRKNRQMAIYKSMNLPKDLSSDLRMSLTAQSSVFKIHTEKNGFNPTFNHTFNGFPTTDEKNANKNGLIVQRMRKKKQRQRQKKPVPSVNQAMFLTRRNPQRNSVYLPSESYNRLGNLRLSGGKGVRLGREVSEFRYENEKPSSISNKIQNFISMKNIDESCEQSHEDDKPISFRRISTHRETCKKPLNRESAPGNHNNRISIKIHNQNKIELNGNNFQIFNKAREHESGAAPGELQRRRSLLSQKEMQVAAAGSLEENDFSKDQVKVDASQFRRKQQVYTSLSMIKRRRKKLSMRQS